MIDDYTDSVPDTTKRLVFERDGTKCWLCGDSDTASLTIAHQINAAAEDHPFPMFQANGTIPNDITNLSHPDNLFPLCASCHSSYDLAFPGWIMLPDAGTLKRYLEHEKNDYSIRLLASQVPRKHIPLRTLPLIDRNQVNYHPAILSDHLHLQRRFDFSNWPKNWMGEPTTVIHRAAWRGSGDSTPIKPIRATHLRGLDRTWQRGVPTVIQRLIGELVRLWARPVPVRVRRS